MTSTGRRRRPVVFVALAVGALVVAACSAGVDVDTERADAVDPTEPVVTDRAGAPSGADEGRAGDEGSDAGADDGTQTSPPDSTGLPDIDVVDPEILVGELGNGLRYLIRRNDNPGGRVDMRLVVDAGSAVEDDDQGGVAHFLEHMLFNGTEAFPANELVAVLRSFGAAFGADINARTTYDDTVYELTMPTDDPEIVSTGLDVLEQWLTSALIDPDEVAAERGVVLDEWRRADQSVNGRIFDEVEALFLAGSAYDGRDPIGTRDDIEGTDASTLGRFYDDWYRPDNAGIVVVGDIDPAAIESALVDRFGSIESDRAPTRPAPTVDPSTEPNVAVMTDADVAEGFGFVSLPLPVDDGLASAERYQQAILEDLAFEMIATRLQNDALAGDAPFDSATASDRSFVRALDAPEVVVDADGPDLGESIQLVAEEFERVRRFGFSDGEFGRAVAARQSAEQAQYDQRASRQDASYAEEYVRHLLTAEPIPTADAQFEFVAEVLARATPETVAAVFTDRLGAAVPHVFVVAPADESVDLPTADELVRLLDSLDDLDIGPRTDTDATVDTLMVAPAPVEPARTDTLGEGFVSPLVLEFDNGVRVGLTSTPVVEGSVAFEARSPGGLAAVPDEAVPDALVAAPVVGQSGVGAFDPVALDAFLSDKEAELAPVIDQFTEGFQGAASTTDLETLFQLIHLMMTEPRVDPVTLDRYVDDQLALAGNPSVDPSYAELAALLDARYDDPRRLLPSVEVLADADAEGVGEVFADRFGDAGDFAFSFAGDFDVATATGLAQRYLGTLPSTGRTDSPEVRDPPPPPGVVIRDIAAGEGARGNVSFLVAVPVPADRRTDLTAEIVQSVISSRLTDTIREQLGESYSPFGLVQIGDGAEPFAETYVAVSTGPDDLERVSAAVLSELADLRSDGPTSTEFDAASAGVQRQQELFSNQQVNDEVLMELTDAPGDRSFEEFYGLSSIAASITADEVADALGSWLPADQRIEVRVRPR